MNVESNLSGHWTDEQLIEHLYGIGPENKHIDECVECRERLAAMVASRHAIESASAPLEQVPFELLAAQRRAVYSRLSRPFHIRRWAAAAATVVLLASGVLMYEQNQQPAPPPQQVTDAQLADQVSQLAQDSEPAPAAPLEGLFDQ